MQATGAQAWFDYVDVSKQYRVHPIMALEAGDKSLDYAVLRVAGTAVTDPWPLSDWGYLRIRSGDGRAAPGSSARHHSASFRGREADCNPPE